MVRQLLEVSLQYLQRGALHNPVVAAVLADVAENLMGHQPR